MVAAPNPSNETPDEAIYRICQEVTFKNEIGARAVKERFSSWLRRHPIEVSGRVPDIASKMVDSFFTRRRPKIGTGQLGLFRPEAIVPIGNGKRAWMDHLSRDQFQDWESVETRAYGQTRAVFESKVAYWQDRRDNWGTYGSLGELERGRYGYVDPDISYDAPADDDGDDD